MWRTPATPRPWDPFPACRSGASALSVGALQRGSNGDSFEFQPIWTAAVHGQVNPDRELIIMAIAYSLARFTPRSPADRRLLDRLSGGGTRSRQPGRGTRHLGIPGWQRAIGITGSALAGPALTFPRVVLVGALLLGLLLVTVTVAALAVAAGIQRLRATCTTDVTTVRTVR